MPRKLLTILIVICAALTGLQRVVADDGHPIAIRQWSDTGFTIETMQNLHVGVGLTEADEKRLPRAVDFQTEDVATGGNIIVRWSAQTSSVTTLGYDQRDNNHLANDITVVGGAWGMSEAKLVSVDGVLVADLNAVASGEIETWLKNPIEAEIGKPWLVVIATAADFDADRLKEIRDELNPQMMVVNSSVGKIDDVKVEVIPHNAIAVSSSGENDQNNNTRFVSLGDEPWAMTDGLAGLFAKKEADCKSSREMFSKLSVEQMNFKPGDGSHTPRWNAEHMMGRELLFFSQIFHAVDPTIPVIDLNPRQMPTDYTFAHSDWSGAEEAAQMMRVEAFTRRFAYLLDRMDLDTKAAGSKFWSPRGLLEQMQRHYNQHSANVVKKMDLEDWPDK